jgi:putative copper resistance protein D
LPGCRAASEQVRGLVTFADAVSPPVRWHTLLTAWQHDWPILLAAMVEVVVVGWYVVSVRRLARRSRSWSPWRTASFLGGMVAIVIAIHSGLAAYDDANFTAHIVQHLLLMNLAPPLLAMGAPITLALQASSRPTTTRLLKVLHSAPMRIVTHPLVAGGLMIATMYAYFLTPIYRISIEHVWFHYFTHLHFLVVGCLYWWPIVGADVLPRRWGHGAKLALLFAAIPWNSFLGIALLSTSKPIAPEHTLADTHAGGALLWVASEILTLVWLLVVFNDWAKHDLRQAARYDRLADRDAANARGRADPPGGAAPPPPKRPTSTWELTKAAIRRPAETEPPDGW